MAIYAYRCAVCGREEEIVQSISSYCKAPNVPECIWDKQPMERKITAPMVAFDTPNWGGYVSPIDGTFIDSRAKQREHMGKHGVVHFDEIAPDIKRNREAIKKQAVSDLKADTIAAVNKVENGYKPVIQTAE